MKLKDVVKDKSILGAYVNNELQDLDYNYNENDNIVYFGIDTIEGYRMYQRTLLFVFYIALKELCPKAQMDVGYSLNKGLYIEFLDNLILEKDTIELIKSKMNYIVSNKYMIEKIELSKEEIINIYNNEGLDFKIDLIKLSKREKFYIYKCNKWYNYFYGAMLPDTSYVDKFDIVSYSPGIILLQPSFDCKNDVPAFKEEPKIYLEHKKSEKWSKNIGVDCLSKINKLVRENQINEKIQIIEAYKQNNIVNIANDIVEQNKRIVLVAGPSSSGKTTFSKRLVTSLKMLNKNAYQLSLDNYFVNREDTPKDENGEYDFEALEALDLELLNDDLNKLLENKKVNIPYYDFVLGKRDMNRAEQIQLKNDDIVIIEGIHGLNDELTKNIYKKDKYLIYVSALTELNIDRQNRINTTDNRLIRRIVRDNRTRGYSVKDTLLIWDSVRAGEEKSIFRFQENADVIFNTALAYEINVLKKYVEPLLKEIDKNDEVWYFAKRLLDMLSYFESLEDESQIPPQSLLREFVG